MSQPFDATRYHSLLIERATLPDVPGAQRVDGGGRDHGRAAPRTFLLEGIQFHPESILTVEGKQLLKNFLDLARGAAG